MLYFILEEAENIDCNQLSCQFKRKNYRTKSNSWYEHLYSPTVLKWTFGQKLNGCSRNQIKVKIDHL